MQDYFCGLCDREYSDYVVRDGPGNSGMEEIKCRHWLCTDCWKMLYNMDKWRCPICKECLCGWIVSHYINTGSDSGAPTEYDSSGYGSGDSGT